MSCLSKYTYYTAYDNEIPLYIYTQNMKTCTVCVVLQISRTLKIVFSSIYYQYIVINNHMYKVRIEKNTISMKIEISAKNKQ